MRTTNTLSIFCPHSESPHEEPILCWVLFDLATASPLGRFYAKNVHLCYTRNCCGAFCFKENINKIILNNKFPCQKYFCKHVFDYYDVAYDRRILIMTFWSSSFVITPHLSPCQILKCSYANFDTHILFKNKNVTLCPVPLFQMFYWLPETLTMFPFFLVLLLNDKLTGRPDWTRTY